MSNIASQESKPFITEIDKSNLKPYVVSFEEDMIMFLLELKLYFTKVWEPKYHADLENLEEKGIDYFNKIIDYPSWGGYAILEDSFSGSTDDEISVLSDRSKELLDYFYGIQLH